MRKLTNDVTFFCWQEVNFFFFLLLWTTFPIHSLFSVMTRYWTTVYLLSSLWKWSSRWWRWEFLAPIVTLVTSGTSLTLSSSWLGEYHTGLFAHANKLLNFLSCHSSWLRIKKQPVGVMLNMRLTANSISKKIRMVRRCGYVPLCVFVLKMSCYYQNRSVLYLGTLCFLFHPFRGIRM